MWCMEDKKSLNLGHFTCRQNHSSSFIEWRLDFFHISNTLQEFVKNTDVLAFFGTDHSPNVFSLELKDMILCGKGFWKFNNSLISNTKYTEKMQNLIFETLRILDQVTGAFLTHFWPMFHLCRNQVVGFY